MATTLKKKEKIDKKAEKAAVVADITARLKASSTAVLADYRGMTVGQMRDLRSKLKGGGIEMVVVKNTLARRAAKAAGYEPLNAELVGPIAMLFAADDVSAPARILCRRPSIRSDSAPSGKRSRNCPPSSEPRSSCASSKASPTRRSPRSWAPAYRRSKRASTARG